MLVKGNTMTQSCNGCRKMRARRSNTLISYLLTTVGVTMALAASSCSGTGSDRVQASGPMITVGVTTVVNKSLGRKITLSSELVPFQEIDVYAKES